MHGPDANVRHSLAEIFSLTPTETDIAQGLVCDVAKIKSGEP